MWNGPTTLCTLHAIRQIVGVCCVLLAFGAHGQNLVPNGDFEQHTTCPSINSQINYASPWYNARTGVPFGPGPTPDYFNSCAAGGMIDVPTNVYGPQAAFGGEAYAGIAVYMNFSPDFREYLEVPLVQPLVAGECYQLTFYMSLAEQFSNSTIGGIGAYFSDVPVVQSVWDTLPVVPQLDHLGAFLTDSLNWTQVSDLYTAQGGEQYLVLGNFHDDAHTDVLDLDASSMAQNCYFLIDSVILLQVQGCKQVGIPATTIASPSISYDQLQEVIEVSMPHIAAVGVTIQDATGRIVVDRRLSGPGTISVPRLTAGVYMCTVRTSAGQILRSERFVVR